MNKWIPAAIGAAVVAVLVGGAWYCGGRAEQALKENLTELNAGPSIKLELARYDRGLFRSHGILNIRFVTPGETDSQLLFGQAFTVVHGPILWDTAFSFRPAAFGVKTHLEAQPEWPQDVTDMLANERVRLTSRFGFSGSNSSHLRIADGELQMSSGKLTLQRADMNVDYDPSDKAMSASFVWPGMQFGSEMGNVKLEDMGFSWTGTYLSKNVQLGSGEYHIGSISASQGEMQAFALNALKLTAKQDLDGSGQKLSSVMDMSLAKVTFMGQDMVSDGSLHLELNNLSMAAMKKLDEMNSAEMTPEQLQTVLTDVMALFEHGAELKIDPMKAQIQGQPFALTLLAKLPAAPTATTNEAPTAPAEAFDPTALFKQAEVDLNVTSSAELVAAWLPSDLVDLLGPTGNFAFQLRQGKMTVNGQPYEPASSEETSEESFEDGNWDGETGDENEDATAAGADAI